MPPSFSSHLRRYGPGTSHAGMSVAEARSYCRTLAQSWTESDTVAATLLPGRLGAGCQQVRAFCRWTEGLGEASGGAKAMALLRWWREEVHALFAGKPRHPVMIALQETVRRFHIPAQPFLDLIYAREQDQLVKRYRTFEQLLQHCRYAAHPVGHLLLYVQECFHADTVKRMEYLCTGLQLAFFWQNVQRDGQADRVYLPEEDRRATGYADEDLHAQRTTPAFATLLAFEAERARDFLLRGLPLIDFAPPSLRPEMERAVQEGMALLDRLATLGYDAWTHRPVLTVWTSARLRLQTWWRRLSVSPRDEVKRTGA